MLPQPNTHEPPRAVAMRTSTPLILLLLALASCADDRTGDVATVGAQSLTQDSLLAYMALTTSPASPYDYADAIAEGWLDLALVSEAAAGGLSAEDTTLQREALAPFLRTEALRRLQNALAVTRPPLTDDRLEQVYGGDSLRIYQRVFVLVPDGRNPLVVESRRARADSIHALARAGAPFDGLAMELSEGPNAKAGGYLGVVTRSQVPPAFRDSLWALEPGGVSPVLRVDQGFQIVRRPPFAEVRDRLAAELLRDAGARADSVLADSLAAVHHLTILPATAGRMRAVLTNPDSLAPDSALVVAFDGGGVTPEQAWLWLAALPDPSRLSLARASDVDLERAARSLASNELLYRMARARGIDVGVDDLADVRADFVTAAGPIFAMFATQDAPRRQEVVDSLVTSVLAGRPGPQLPAGLATALRRRVPHALDRGVLGVVARDASFQRRADSLAPRS
jgi:hypothetical protein